MNSLVLHERTQQQLHNFGKSPSHAVLVSGAPGSGKTSVARQLACDVLHISGSLDDYPYAMAITQSKTTSIGVESIRELEHFLSLKVPSNSAYNRVILVEDSHLLTIEAQNALLKTLEEPPAGTLIILITNSEQDLLPTIRSRVQKIAVLSPTLDQLYAYFREQGNDQLAIKRAYSMTGGLPGLMSAMLTDSDHPLLLATHKARELLGQSSYDRLLSVDSLAKDKLLTQDVLFILQQMAHVSLQTATGPASKQWQNILTASYETSQSLANSAQPKLALTKLMLSL